MDYEEQLTRVLEETPDITNEQSRFEVPSPNVRVEGNVTVFENFQAVVDRLNRDESHLLRYLQSELATSAHIDESGRARFTGKFRQRRVDNATEEYTTAFVICPECGLPDTRLTTEQGAEVINCDACGAISPTSD